LPVEKITVMIIRIKLILRDSLRNNLLPLFVIPAPLLRSSIAKEGGKAELEKL